jgi:hypothetical protein
MRSISVSGAICFPIWIVIVFSRLFKPLLISTSDFGSFSVFATTILTAALASPSRAFAVTQTSMASSVTAVMPSRLALTPGLTWHSNWMMPVDVRAVAAFPAMKRIADMDSTSMLCQEALKRNRLLLSESLQNH